MAFPFSAVAAYEFEAANDGEMSVKVGDELVVESEADGGWYVCINSAGETGYVPAGYLEPKQQDGSTIESSQDTATSSPKEKTLKKRSSKKKIDGALKSKTSDQKSSKKKEKTKEEGKKPKREKKASTTDSAPAPAPSNTSESTPEADVSTPTADSVSPRLNRPLPTPSTANADATESPHAVRFDHQPTAGPIESSSSETSLSNNSPRVRPSHAPPMPQVPLPANAAKPKSAVPTSTSAPTSPPVEKKLPPALPQKRISFGEGLKGSSKLDRTPV